MILLFRYRDLHLLLIILGVLPIAALLLFNLMVDVTGYPKYIMNLEDVFDMLYNITQGIKKSSEKEVNTNHLSE